MSRWIRVTVVSIQQGVIQVIGPYGNQEYYRQCGIDKLDKATLQSCIANGLLSPEVFKLPELPSKYALEVEDEEIMGKPERTFKIR